MVDDVTRFLLCRSGDHRARAPPTCLDGHARAVFNGRIIVRPGAQKTNSKQTNNNLLLSGDARADSQPQLEIYADDVRCTHGATLGPLDEHSLFYLQARGIDAESARRVCHEYFNGILDGHVRAVFNGRIIVRPGAQKTNSKQTNNNLLLSGDARADSQPQLEIYADDVRCTHGATLGPLDENSLFYLQARGIDAESARRMLTMGFGLEVLERMGEAAVRDKLEVLVRGGLQSGTVKTA